MKVMIVDDSPEMRGLIRTVLGGVAREFVECGDGREAVARFETERPDWAIMDIAMGSMDGLTATRLITSKFPGSNILIVTQHHNPKLREIAQDSGAAGFVLKENLMDLPSALASAGAHDSKPQTGQTDLPDKT